MSDVVVESTELFSPEELDNIRQIRLISGENLLGVILGANDEWLLVRRPSRIIMRFDENTGTTTIVLERWMQFSSEENHALRAPTVVCYTKVIPEIKKLFVKSIEAQIKSETQEGGMIEEPDEKDFEWPEGLDFSPDKVN